MCTAIKTVTAQNIFKTNINIVLTSKFFLVNHNETKKKMM